MRIVLEDLRLVFFSFEGGPRVGMYYIYLYWHSYSRCANGKALRVVEREEAWDFKVAGCINKMSECNTWATTTSMWQNGGLRLSRIFARSGKEGEVGDLADPL